MAKKHITLVDVRQYYVDHEIDLSAFQNGDISLQRGIATAVTRGLNGGKSPKQITDRIHGYLTSISGEKPVERSGDEAQPDETFEGSLDDIAASHDLDDIAASHDLDDIVDPETLAEEGELDDEQSGSGEDGEAASDEDEGEGEGDEKVDRSVVKGKYRAEYKRRGNARNCGDWMARICDGVLLGAKKKLKIEALQRLCELNEAGDLFAKYTTADKRTTNGWQGRARMSTGLAVRLSAARNNGLSLHRDDYNAMCAKLDADNKRYEEAGKPERTVDWQVFEEIDDIVIICPLKGDEKDGEFFSKIIAKHGENSEKLAEGRKKAKEGKVA